MRIDAHQHFWRPGAPWHGWPDASLPMIHRDFSPGDLLPLLDAGAIGGSVLVQSQAHDRDTDALLELAAATPRVLAVVGWVDIVAPHAAERIAALAARAKLAGLRPMLQDLPADWILQPAAADGLVAMVEHGLVFDALVRPAHLPAVAALADRHPGLTIVVDHAAKPDIAGGDMEDWARAMAAVAARPNIVCKLSGLVTEAGADWSAAELAPYVARLVALFGADRLMWGSDWPVVLLRASYADWLAAARSLIPAARHDGVFGATARRIYGLSKTPASIS